MNALERIGLWKLREQLTKLEARIKKATPNEIQDDGWLLEYVEDCQGTVEALLNNVTVISE